MYMTWINTVHLSTPTPLALTSKSSNHHPVCVSLVGCTYTLHACFLKSLKSNNKNTTATRITRIYVFTSYKLNWILRTCRNGVQLGGLEVMQEKDASRIPKHQLLSKNGFLSPNFWQNPRKPTWDSRNFNILVQAVWLAVFSLGSLTSLNQTSPRKNIRKPSKIRPTENQVPVLKSASEMPSTLSSTKLSNFIPKWCWKFMAGSTRKGNEIFPDDLSDTPLDGTQKSWVSTYTRVILSITRSPVEVGSLSHDLRRVF